jgi:sigma-B regulation protein RsbU (phosphoserine phosphatase)
MFLGEIDRAGTIMYCNAGHPAAVLVRADGSVEFLRTGGLILGPDPDATYTVGLEAIEPGDLVALYSDGITEAVDDNGEEYGRERFVHTVRSARHLDPIAIVDKIFAEVEEHAATSPPADDQTMLIVKRRSGEPEEIPA